MAQQPAQTIDATATLILRSGQVITLNPRNEVAQAIAIREGRILAVGSDQDGLKLRTPATEVIDLRGRTVIPGLIDRHSHPTSDGMHIFRPDLSKATTRAEISHLIGDKVKESKPGEWITNLRIWNATKLAEKRNPAGFDLDAVSPNSPVFLTRGHLGVANTAALKRQSSPLPTCT